MNKKYIGKNSREVNLIFRQFGITPLRNLLTPKEFEQIAHETIKGNQRKRVFIPEVVFWLMAMVGRYGDSMSGVLKKAWNHMKGASKGFPKRVVSEVAFTKARKRLPVEFFKRIFNYVVEIFYHRYAQIGYWHGFRVKIIDGTTLTLPEAKALRKCFGSRRNQNKNSSAPVQSHLVGIFSAFTGVCLGFAFGCLRLGEQTGLFKLLESMGKGDLLLGDRGYVGYRLWRALLNREIEFLFRLKDDFKPKKIKRLGARDWLVRIGPPKKQCGKDCDLPELELRLISYETPGFRPIYLLTSLVDAVKYSREALISLYHERWQIETRYNEMKNMMEIENLRSRTPEGIIKEIWTHITLVNLIRLVMLESAEASGVRAIDLSYLDALEKIKDTTLVMLHSPVHMWLILYEEMIEEISQMKILKRPGRSYSRRIKRRAGLSESGLFVEVSYVPVYKNARIQVA